MTVAAVIYTGRVKQQVVEDLCVKGRDIGRSYNARGTTRVKMNVVLKLK